VKFAPDQPLLPRQRKFENFNRKTAKIKFTGRCGVSPQGGAEPSVIIIAYVHPFLTPLSRYGFPEFVNSGY